jgi:regulatory protein
MIIDDKLMRYVVFKKRTEMEIRQKCKRLEYNEEYIKEIIQYLSENEYIDDVKYVEKYINNILKLKKSSIFEMKMDLLRRGIKENYIDDYVESHQEELEKFEKDSAKQIVRKKIQITEIEKIKRYLKGKGYSYSSISEAIDNE